MSSPVAAGVLQVGRTPVSRRDGERVTCVDLLNVCVADFRSQPSWESGVTSIMQNSECSSPRLTDFNEEQRGSIKAEHIKGTQ